MRISAGVLGLSVVLLTTAVPAIAQRERTERFQNRDVVSQEIIVRFRGAASAEARSQSIRNEDSDISASSPVGRSGAVRLRSRARSVAALIQAYSRRSDVEYAEPNFVWKASDLPNDSFFNEQWALQNTGQVVVQSGTAGADIKAVQAWDIAEGSRGIVVGMIDTGIDYTHPDLLDNIWSAPSAFSVIIGGQTIQCAAGTHGFNAVARNCNPMDDDGHGTHTAGIVGASGNNAVAVSGVSRVASIMALKFLDSSGQGTTANAIAAIEFAIKVKQQFPTAANLRVLNASWGGFAFSQALLDEINLAGANGMLFVTSAGNSSQNIDAVPEYPAAYNAASLIAVAATNNRDQLADFTNYGPGKVHLSAPGVEILSTLRGKFYGRQSGTSSAAAVVSGAAALVLSACSLNTTDLKSNILSTVDVIPGMAADTSTGGRLNVNNAIRSCVGALPGTFTLSVAPFAQTIPFGTASTFSVSISTLNGFASPITFTATNLPEGMSASFTPNSTLNSLTTLSIDVGPTVVQGTYLIGISATGGGVARTIGILVTAGVPTGCIIDPAFGGATGRLDVIDAASLHRPPSFADYCVFTLADDRAVELEMRGGSIDSYLYLLSSSGTVIASDDNGLHSGSDSLITAELFAGTYSVEATTATPGQTGAYTLRLKAARPNITSVSPNFGTQGTSVNITVTGTVFFGQSISMKVYSCPGVVVTNLQVVSSTTVSATLTLPNNTGNCNVVVANVGGESNTLAFTINPPTPTITGISPDSGIQGQIVPVTITGTNFVGAVQLMLDGAFISITSKTPTTITANLSLSVGGSPGVYNVSVITFGGTSNPVSFTVLLAPPTFTSIFPSPAGGPGFSASVVLTGSSFVGQVQVLTDSKITVTDLVVRNSNAIDAKFNVATDTPYGDYPVKISTSAGISGVQIFKVVPPPSITSYTPSRVFIGTETVVKLTGTNFYCYFRASIDGADIVINGADPPGLTPCPDQTTKYLKFSVSSSAAAGPRTVQITAPNGVSNPITIDVVPIPAIIQSITPPYGAQGTTTTVTITGSGMDSGTVSATGGGVVASTLSSSPTSLTAALVIAPNAAIGPRDLTVTTAKGISDPAIFSVTPPTWPDLTVTQNIPPVLGSGSTEVFDITVMNVGTKATSSPITVTNTLFANDTFLSASSGWSCSTSTDSNGRPVVMCTTEQSIPVNSQLALRLTVKMFGGSGNHRSDVAVRSPEDYNVVNDTATTSSQVIGEFNPSIVIAPSSLQPGQQATVSIVVSSKFPHDYIDSANVLTVSFVPSVSGTPADPALQFATGGKTASFLVKANTLVAEIQGIPGPIGFQPGTVAGTLTFTLKIRMNSGAIITRTATVSIASTAPSIREVAPVKTPTGFEAAITLVSSTRDVRTIIFQFNTTTPVKLNCGSVSGCTAGASVFNFNVTSVFNTWFASSSEYGGVAILHVPFNISQGTILGSISVTLTNNLGNSNTMSFPIP